MMGVSHGGPRGPNIIAAALIVLVLGACAETELLFHSAKQARGRDTVAVPQGGVYKIGNPYQIDNVWYYPAVDYNYQETGIASWYGDEFHGKATANGDTFDMNSVTAAHRTLPLPSIVEVANLENGRTIQVRVNDRGPFARGRIIDLSRRSAQLLGFERQGTAKVRVRILAEPSQQIAMQMGKPDNSGLVETNGVRGAPRASVASAAIPGTPPAPRPSAPKGSSALGATVPASLAIPSNTVTMQQVRPTSIYVQAGAFAEYNNANRARTKLSGLAPANISQTGIDRQPMFRVRLGPVTSVAEADRLLERVAASGYPEARVIVD